jgi:hypothetical protein
LATRLARVAGRLGALDERLRRGPEGWRHRLALVEAADLHPISRACMGYRLWSLAGLGQHGDRMEAAVTAARIAADEGNGAIFAPLAMCGAGGLRAGGTPAERLVRWLDGMNSAILTAMRHLDDIEAWAGR